MKRMEKKVEEYKWNKSGFAFMTQNLIGTKARSGYRAGVIDLDSATNLHSNDVSDEMLGSYVSQALHESQAWSLEKTLSFANDPVPHATWAEELRVFGGYKFRKDIFRRMKQVEFYIKNGQIIFIPTSKDRGVFNGRGKDFHIIIPEDSSKADIGVALRLAFERSR